VIGRPPLDVGTFGKIGFVARAPGVIEASAKFRDFDGAIRRVTKRGPSKAAAERALKAALVERRVAGGNDEITPDTRIGDLADEWLRRLDASDRAISTKRIYHGAVEGHIRPALGQLRVREASVGACDRALTAISRDNGPGAAKTARAVLSGILGLAARHDVIGANPVRDTESISKQPVKTPRALTVEQAADFTARLRTLDRALYLDLVDLVVFCLATGARIGEALACNGDSLDLGAGTWEVDATIIRVAGQGLIRQQRTKTDAGWRVLALPPHAVELLRRHVTKPRYRYPEGVVFGSPSAPTVRDPSNCANDLREIRERDDFEGYEWITFHTFRKTVATRMDEAGLTAREIADQLGHAKPSMTQDVYMGRKVVTARAAEVLGPIS
jgi:integrase